MKYLREFVIGSSYCVFILHFIEVYHNKNKNYTYGAYTFLAPIWLGVWNVISLMIAEKYGLNRRERYLLVSLIAVFSIINIVFCFNTYKFIDTKSSRRYIFGIILKYLFIWNVIVYYLDKYV